MTDTNVEVFRGRDARAATLERLAHPTGGGAIATADLEGQFRIATALANATEAMPRAYRKQPGAVLLALAWSQQHGVDVLTAIQSVSFIEGKAVVDATMQRALAKRAGYVLTITVGADAAVVGIHQGGRELGSATYTLGEAETAGLAGKSNWQKNPEDMLVARATTRAMRRFAPDVLLGMVVSDEVDESADVVELATTPFVNGPPLTNDPEREADHAAPAENKTEDGAGEVEPENVPDEVPPTVPPPVGGASGWNTADAMRTDMKARGITTADVVKWAQDEAKRLGVPTPAGSLNAIWRHPSPEFAAALVAWVRNHDEQQPDDVEPF